MPPSLPGRVIEPLRRTVLCRDDAALTDGPLLERRGRVRGARQSAWADGLGGCRRTLTHYQDAEDEHAFPGVILVTGSGTGVERMFTSSAA
jgi:hypothetical protein